MNNTSCTLYEDRVKNAPTIEFCMKKFFTLNKEVLEEEIYLKRPGKHQSFSNFSFYSNLKLKKGNKPPQDDTTHLLKQNNLQTIIQRGKKIKKKILNTLISMQSLDLEEKDDFNLDYVLNNMKDNKELSPSFSPREKLQPTVTLLNSPAFNCLDSLLKPVNNSSQISASSSKRKFLSKAFNISAYFDKKKATKDEVNEYRLKLLKENNYRCLLKEEYRVYDSCSDNEDESIIKYALLPQSVILFVWNIIILIVTLYYVLIFPFCLAFRQYFALWMIGFEFISEVIYIIDVFIQFICPITLDDSQQEYNCNLKDIAINYISGWFCFDLVIALPYCSIINFLFHSNHLTLDSSNSIHLIKLVKILKVLKLIIRSNDNSSQESSILGDFIPIKLKRLVEFFFYFSIFNHTLACLWILIGQVSYPNWIVQQNILDSQTHQIYISAIYYTLASIYTVGYGDIYPTTTYERYFNIALQTIGLFLYSYVISSMTNILKASPKDIRFKHQNDLFENVKIDFNIKEKLYFKIKKFLHHSYKLNHEERAVFLQELPNPIKNSLISQMYTDLMKFEIFHNTSVDFKTRVILCFKPACYSKSEIIIKRGDNIEDVIFIKRGILEIESQYKNEIIKIKKLHSGDHFGEVDMLLNHESKFDLVIKSKYVELLLLSKENLIAIGEEFPSLFNKMRKKSLIQFTLLKLKLKERIKEIDSLSLKKCEMIINFMNENDTEYKQIEENSLKTNKQFSANPISEIISEKTSEEEQSVKEKIIVIDNVIDEIDKENELDSRNLEQELSNFKPSSLFSRGNSLKSKKMITKQNSLITKDKNSLKENKQRKQFHSSESLFNVRPSNQFPIRSDSNDQCNFLQVIKPNQFNVNTARSSIDVIAQINHPSESIIESINSSRVIQKKSNKILRNIKESSMNINQPSQFYSQIFEKWQITNQIERITSIWEAITFIKNTMSQIKQKTKSSFYRTG